MTVFNDANKRNGRVIKIVPSYAYVQYRDDENIVAFFSAYNTLAQYYLDSMNALKLPYWPAPYLAGDLLSFVVEGIYGQTRPERRFSSEKFPDGAYNTTEYDTVAYNDQTDYEAGVSRYVPDEYWKRILTWDFYKADGQQFSIPWLKRRVARFLRGEAGRDPRIDETNDISVNVNDGVFEISIPKVEPGISVFLKEAIEQRMVRLPFMYIFNVTVRDS